MAKKLRLGLLLRKVIHFNELRREALFDAANETRTIVAAAAFRALADMAAFDRL